MSIAQEIHISHTKGKDLSVSFEGYSEVQTAVQEFVRTGNEGALNPLGGHQTV